MKFAILLLLTIVSTKTFAMPFVCEMSEDAKYFVTYESVRNKTIKADIVEAMIEDVKVQIISHEGSSSLALNLYNNKGSLTLDTTGYRGGLDFNFQIADNKYPAAVRCHIKEVN